MFLLLGEARFVRGARASGRLASLFYCERSTDEVGEPFFRMLAVS